MRDQCDIISRHYVTRNDKSVYNNVGIIVLGLLLLLMGPMISALTVHIRMQNLLPSISHIFSGINVVDVTCKSHTLIIEQ